METTAAQVNTPLNKSQSFPLLIVICLICLLLGLAGGYYLTKKTTPPPPKPKQPTAQRLLEETQKSWGSLVNGTNFQSVIKGTVTAIKEGNGPENAEVKSQGKYLTLKNGSDEHIFFVTEFSDWYQGDYEDYWSWERYPEKKVNVGDTFVLIGDMPIKDESTIESFRGLWIFKDLK